MEHDIACPSASRLSTASPSGSPTDATASSASPTSRRALLAGVGAIGAVGAASLLPTTASAAVLPTAEDTELLAAAKRFELAVYELYKVAAANRDGEELELFETIAKNHEAYAEGIASLTGVAADEMNQDIFDSLGPAFSASSTREVALAAYDLESRAIATHTQLLGTYENIDAVELTGAIVTGEARHAALMAHVAGLGSDLDAMLVNTASAADLSGDA